MTSLTPKKGGQEFTSANNSPLNVLGSIEILVRLGGRGIMTTFYVVERLSQDVILGAAFLQNTGAILDFNSKRLSLFNNAVSVPLLTAIDSARAIRTTKRIRIPANCEVILPVRLPKLPKTVGITESLPQTLDKGIKVASVLVDCDRQTSLCRVANPTSRPALWPAGHAFAYLSPLSTDGVGVELINISECCDRVNTVNVARGVAKDNITRGGNDDDNDKASGPCNRALPPHEKRLSILHALGIKIGNDVLSKEQAEKLSELLYEYRDIMAENYMQVPEARIPPHKIPLVDDRPAIQKRFRYDPVKEQKLENLCEELLEADIIKESQSLWSSPVFLVSKPDGSSRFLVDFRAVNAKTKPLFCALPSLEDIFDQVSEEKPEVFSVLDLRAGYYGIPLEESSQQYTAFSTKNHHYHFQGYPWGT